MGDSRADTGPIVPGYWKNGVWNALEVIDPTKHSWALAGFTEGEDVYIGGYSTNSSGNAVAGFWKNGKWTALQGLDDSRSSGVNTIAVTVK